MKPTHTHGISGYRYYACRCAICKAAWSEKAKAMYEARKLKAPETNTLTSWWIGIPQAGLTAYVERTQQARMHESRLGHGRGRPISTAEIER